MGLNFDYGHGQTPLEEEEKLGLLVSSISTRAELDEFEQYNIESAIEWTMRRKLTTDKLFSEAFVCELHRKMFAEVWKWAGEFRKTNKNLGVDWHKVPIQLKQLNEDARYWLEHKTYSEGEISIHYKHRIVSIHCFSNGNGRHSRLMADLIVSHVFGKPVFSWGAKEGSKKDIRGNYLKALKGADKGEINALVKFART